MLVDRAQQVEVELPRAQKFFYVGLESGVTAANELKAWITRGVQERNLTHLVETNPDLWLTYLERARHEYEVLVEKGFADYILAVGDIIREMRRRGCLVVTRGSAGGSLILWLIGASVTGSM